MAVASLDWREGSDRLDREMRRPGATLSERIAAIAAVSIATLFVASPALAQTTMLFEGDPVHPACILALVDSGSDERMPITVGVSLPGCKASPRSEIKVSYEDETSWIEDAALLGEGERFGYRALGRLDNGIYGVAMRRVGADGKAHVSLAAIDLVERAMIRNSLVIQVPTLELLGILPLPDAQSKSFRQVGNLVRVKVGWGANARERSVDFTELGKARKKR